jgi:hypothetical protein
MSVLKQVLWGFLAVLGSVALAFSAFRGEPGRKSEGLIVPMAFGGQHNRRGGKAPWFEACLTERRIRRVA